MYYHEGLQVKLQQGHAARVGRVRQGGNELALRGCGLCFRFAASWALAQRRRGDCATLGLSWWSSAYSGGGSDRQLLGHSASLCGVRDWRVLCVAFEFLASDASDGRWPRASAGGKAEAAELGEARWTAFPHSVGEGGRLGDAVDDDFTRLWQGGSQQGGPHGGQVYGTRQPSPPSE